MARNRFSVVAPLVFLTILLAGAAARTSAQSPLAELMATAPNRLNPLAGETNPLPTLEKLLGVDQQFWVKVGPPEASLSVSLVEPPDKSRPPRGTILVLHGILARSATMLPAANALAKAGYRAVLVDLRGHGRSTGKFLTYGIQDAKDLSQVIDELARRNLLAGPLGAYGISYGATTAIHFAGGDRRVRAVVAVEPFAAARDEVPHFGRVDGAGHRALDLRAGLSRGPRRGGPAGPVRSRRGRRRQGHPPDHCGGPHRPRHERLDRAASSQRAIARRRAGPQPPGLDSLSGPRGLMDRSRRSCGRRGPRLVRPLSAPSRPAGPDSYGWETADARRISASGDERVS